MNSEDVAPGDRLLNIVASTDTSNSYLRRTLSLEQSKSVTLDSTSTSEESEESISSGAKSQKRCDRRLREEANVRLNLFRYIRQLRRKIYERTCRRVHRLEKRNYRRRNQVRRYEGQSWEDLRPDEERQNADPDDVQAGPVYMIRPHKELYHFPAQLPRGFDEILQELGDEKRQSRKKELCYAVLRDSLACQKRLCDKQYDNLDLFKTLHERFWSKPNRAGRTYIKEYRRLVLRPRVAIKLE